MVLALEPKFTLPGIGAVGTENTFLVTQSGLEPLDAGSDEIRRLPPPRA
jgi:Xaa-Pro aminopeptidase